jgi:peroxiredoxin Q/BCP
MSKPQKGDAAPDFELPTADGPLFKLSAGIGHPTVLYFYAEDDTEGCTVENLEFTTLLPKFAAVGATVVGISADSVQKHCKFRDKHGVGTVLVADPGHVAIEAYGVWGPKVTFGHHLIGLIRSTFLVDANGRIAEAWHVTRIKGHAEKVLAAVEAVARD